MKDHLFKSNRTGELFDCRVDKWHEKPALRPVFCRTFRDIKTTAELRATLRNGPHAWPGGYPMYFICHDGAALSFETVRAELRLVTDSILNGHCDGWRVVACDINYEDSELFCEHNGKRIESAYGESETESGQ